MDVPQQISEEIHEQRRCRLPREPGVGAEITPPEPDDNQTFDHGAKTFIPLEEMTAQEEKVFILFFFCIFKFSLYIILREGEGER